jgi:hypothetical protein
MSLLCVFETFDVEAVAATASTREAAGSAGVRKLRLRASALLASAVVPNIGIQCGIDPGHNGGVQRGGAEKD